MSVLEQIIGADTHSYGEMASIAQLAHYLLSCSGSNDGTGA